MSEALFCVLNRRLSQAGQRSFASVSSAASSQCRVRSASDLCRRCACHIRQLLLSSSVASFPRCTIIRMCTLPSDSAHPVFIAGFVITVVRSVPARPSQILKLRLSWRPCCQIPFALAHQVVAVCATLHHIAASVCPLAISYLSVHQKRKCAICTSFLSPKLCQSSVRIYRIRFLGCYPSWYSIRLTRPIPCPNFYYGTIGTLMLCRYIDAASSEASLPIEVSLPYHKALILYVQSLSVTSICNSVGSVCDPF